MVEDVKKQYLEMVREELQSVHPDIVPSKLLCIFSQDVITEPVITSVGRAYSRSAIVKWLEAGHTEDPCRSALTINELYDFKELVPYLKLFKTIRSNYNRQKAALVRQAFSANSEEEEIPAIFKCSVSGKLMNKAYITADARLIDGSQCHDLNPSMAVEFNEFNNYLNHFHAQQKEQSRSVNSELKSRNGNGYGSSMLGWFHSLLTSAQSEKEKTEKPASSFRFDK